MYGLRYLFPFRLLEIMNSKKEKMAALFCVTLHAMISFIGLLWHSNNKQNVSLKRNSRKVNEDIKKQIGFISAIKRSADNSRTEEVNVNGLIIIAAIFGNKKSMVKLFDNKNKLIKVCQKLSNPESCFKRELVNVTDPLQCYVSESKLKLVGKFKRDMFGFCNPIHESKKKPWILILYITKGEEKSIFISESDVINIK